MGPLMVDVQGLELTPDDIRLLQSPAVGGVILFSRNFFDRQQLQALTRQIHALRNPKLLIAIDQEGGRVQRLRNTFTELPPMASFGNIYRQDRSRAIRLAETGGWLMAVELLEVGIDFSFAPVVDLNFGANDVIGDRSFDRDVDVVSVLANAWIRGMRRAGMGSVAKHFPGHGGVSVDSHVSLPVDNREIGDLLIDDLVPFQRVIEHGVNGVMSAHIVFDHIDQQPATFSHYWLQTVLREQLAFKGAVFSDDLSMGAVCDYGDVIQRSQMALRAGCDMVLICNCPADAQYACANMKEPLSATSLSRLLPFHGKLAQDPNLAARKAAAAQNIADLLPDSGIQLDLE